jgi:hypothetical protein
MTTSMIAEAREAIAEVRGQIAEVQAPGLTVAFAPQSFTSAI